MGTLLHGSHAAACVAASRSIGINPRVSGARGRPPRPRVRASVFPSGDGAVPHNGILNHRAPSWGPVLFWRSASIGERPLVAHSGEFGDARVMRREMAHGIGLACVAGNEKSLTAAAAEILLAPVAAAA